MPHCFDSLEGHYIYFFDNGKLNKAPILVYIRKAKKDLEKYFEVIGKVQVAMDKNEEEAKKIGQKYEAILKEDFQGICEHALKKARNYTLSVEEREKWNYLMQIAKTEISNEEIKFHYIKK